MRRLAFLLFPLLAGCATRSVDVATAVPPVAPAPAPIAPPLPAGATPGMRVPVALADGSFPTPNQHLSAAATLWHLRAGLNVAALACPGVQGATITASYNALLRQEKAALAAAEASYAAEYRQGGGDWRDRYDDSMTRLYNFFSQTPARNGLCAAAERTLAMLSTAPAGTVATAATVQLAAIDQPFVEFYRAYDAWRTGATVGVPAVVIAAAAPPVAVASRPPTSQPATLQPVVARPAVAATPAHNPAVLVSEPARAPAVRAIPVAATGTVAVAAPPRPRPRLELDPSVFEIAVPPTR
jgi:hypothetical protein